MLEIGSVIDGKYKILNEVGHGGMSIVYLAMNEKANKQWAIKEVRKDGGKNLEVVKQSLIAETEMLKNLRHPNLPSIVDVIEDSNRFLIVMDYIEGNSLKKALEEFGAQAQEDVIKWAKQLCDVLGYLHSRIPPIIYRDMKPANIMLRPDGNVTLIDFGTARELKERNLADTTCLGTMGYAAPEQFGGMGQTDARTDIYCLGATMYHLVTGINPSEPPYEIRPIREINPTLSSGLEKIIIKCTQRNPDDRFQCAAELMYALEHYNEIDDEYRKKQKIKLGAFFASCLLTIIGIVMAICGHLQIQQEIADNYELKLKQAEGIDDYYSAILIAPNRVEAYLQLNDMLMQDGVLSKEDGQALMKLRAGLESTDKKGYMQNNDVLAELKENNIEGYYDVCYNFGYSFLNYEVDTDNELYIYASTWFSQIDSNDSYSDAKVYCDIADCLKLISQYSNAKIMQTDKFYSEYENLLTKLHELEQNSFEYHDIDQKEQTWRIINSIINANIVPLLEISQEENEIQNLLEEMATEINCIVNDIETKSVVKTELEQLLKEIEATQRRINTVK